MMTRGVFSVRDMLADALMWSGGVAGLLIFGQDGAQVRIAEDQHPVQDLAAQRASQALAATSVSPRPTKLVRAADQLRVAPCWDSRSAT